MNANNDKKNRIVARAPGKIMLLGEYAVLEGAPALVMAVNRYATAQIDPSNQEQFIIDAPQLGLFGACLSPTYNAALKPGPLALTTAVIDEAVVWLSQEQKRVSFSRICVDTGELYAGDQKGKIGIGSSAAVVTALLAALIKSVTPEFSPYNDPSRFLVAAMSAHRQGQSGTGSGADVAASCTGGVLQFEKAAGDTVPRIQPVQLPADLKWAAVWTGQPASTPALVQAVRKLRTTNANEYRRLLNHLTVMARTGCQQLKKCDTAGFLATVRTYQQGLFELGKVSKAPIVTPLHAQLAELAFDLQVAFKPSGAGGGDLGIAFSTQDKTLERFVQKATDLGATPMNFAMSPVGVHLLS